MKSRPPLANLIAAYLEAHRAYLAKPDTDDASEWDAFQLAEEAVLAHPCQSIDEIRAKTSFIISDANLLDTTKEGIVLDGSEDCLVLLLRSLLGEGP